MTIRNTAAEAARKAGKRPQDIPKPPPKAQTETQISAAIRKWIEKIGGIATRVNAGTIQLAGRWIQMAPPGTSDSLNIIPVRVPGQDQPFGLFLAIEVKKPGGVTSIKQQEFIERVNRLGGIAFWADSVASAKAQLAAALAERGLTLWTP